MTYHLPSFSRLRSYVVLFTLFLLGTSNPLEAQLSVFTTLENPEAPFWDPIERQDLRFLRAGFGIGAGYFWTVGKAEALAFGPAIRHHQFSSYPSNPFLASIRLTGLEFKTRVYPVHLLFGCDCQNLKERIFLEVSAAWHYARMQLTAPNVDELVQDKSIGMGLGFGLHFPVGKRISLDPVIRFCQFPELNWEGLERFASEPMNPYFRTTSDLNVFQIELHVRFKSLK